MSFRSSKALVCWFGITPGLEFCQAFMIGRTNSAFVSLYLFFPYSLQRDI